ncbi:hypothetical protein HK105_202383 [Polyrhizophydium stewartii]|uniref:SHSP domain-containing protein n=1 Tax=Polyrhizophydium stewartii TaxID=2732419 RepID=A0ABR4NES9_9FUNG
MLLIPRAPLFGRSILDMALAPHCGGNCVSKPRLRRRSSLSHAAEMLETVDDAKAQATVKDSIVDQDDNDSDWEDIEDEDSNSGDGCVMETDAAVPAVPSVAAHHATQLAKLDTSATSHFGLPLPQVADDDTGITYRMAVPPGLTKEDLELQVDASTRTLTLTGRRTDSNGATTLFRQQVSISPAADANKLRAELGSEGILRVTFERAAAVPERDGRHRITIQ